MSILDKIAKRNFMRVGDAINAYAEDWDTLFRLAELAEQAAESVRDGGPFMNTDPEWAKEAWRILHPSPPVPEGKGTVMWSGDNGNVLVVADQITADEAATAFAPKPPVAPPMGVEAEILASAARERHAWDKAKDAEIARLNQECRDLAAQVVSMRGTYADRVEIARLTDEVASLKQHSAETLGPALRGKIVYRDRCVEMGQQIDRLRGALESICIMAANGSMVQAMGMKHQQFDEIAVVCADALRGGK